MQIRIRNPGGKPNEIIRLFLTKLLIFFLLNSTYRYRTLQYLPKGSQQADELDLDLDFFFVDFLLDELN